MSASNENPHNEGGSVPDDSDDDFKYEELSLDDDWSLSEGEEDLEAMILAIKLRAEAKTRAGPGSSAATDEAVDDFLRNFLYQTGMTETLGCFQAEWTETLREGMVDAGQVGVVPSVYVENQRLESELRIAEREREEYKLAASAAAQILLRAQKARDFHLRQHARVLREKQRLIEEMRKLKVQCDSYEPKVKRMNDKYQAVVKQTVLMALERDAALAQTTKAMVSVPGSSASRFPGRISSRVRPAIPHRQLSRQCVNERDEALAS